MEIFWKEKQQNRQTFSKTERNKEKIYINRIRTEDTL